MIDASKESLEQNIAMTREVVEYAAAHKVCVEAEIGKIKGRDYEASFEGGDFLVQVENAVKLVKRQGWIRLLLELARHMAFIRANRRLILNVWQR